MTPTATETATEAVALEETQYALATGAEISQVQAILQAAGHLAAEKRIAYLGLVDPSRNQSMQDRRFRVFIHDISGGGAPSDLLVSVTRGEILKAIELDTKVSGELPVLEEEFEVVETLLATDERWLAALAARDLDVAKVRVAPLSAGVFEYHDEKGCRILRGLAFVQDFPEDSAWAHPVDGWWLRGCGQQGSYPGHRPRRHADPGRARKLHRS